MLLFYFGPQVLSLTSLLPLKVTIWGFSWWIDWHVPLLRLLNRHHPLYREYSTLWTDSCNRRTSCHTSYWSWNKVTFQYCLNASNYCIYNTKTFSSIGYRHYGCVATHLHQHRDFVVILFRCKVVFTRFQILEHFDLISSAFVLCRCTKPVQVDL